MVQSTLLVLFDDFYIFVEEEKGGTKQYWPFQCVVIFKNSTIHFEIRCIVVIKTLENGKVHSLHAQLIP